MLILRAVHSRSRSAQLNLHWLATAQCLVWLCLPVFVPAFGLDARECPESLRRPTDQQSVLDISWLKPEHARFYVQELPVKYYQGKEDMRDTLHGYAFGSLGEHISGKHELWDSKWHQSDLWFANQLRTSPLRTYNESEADIIVVPASFYVHDIAVQVCCPMPDLLPSSCHSPACLRLLLPCDWVSGHKLKS